LNEILVKQQYNEQGGIDTETLFHNVQHELLHSACIHRITVKKDDRFLSGILYKKRNYEQISSGYGSFSGKLKAFEEFLVETTNLQIQAENNDRNPSYAYINGVVFLTELVDDMTRKTNEHQNYILSEFQTGSFEGRRGKLKIIKDLYGEEALNKLIRMKNNRESMLETAEAFGLSGVKKKIEDIEKERDFALSLGKKRATHHFKKNKEL
jgi:hypothetical protein